MTAIFVATQATADNWRHLAAVARAYHRSPQLEADRLAAAVHRIATGGDPDKGGSGVEVALFGATQVTELAERGGHRWSEMLANFPDLGEDDRDVRRALVALGDGRTEVFEALAQSFDRLRPRSLKLLLGALGGLASWVDPDGTGQTLILNGSEAPPWGVKARQIPEWRRQLITRLDAPETPEATARDMTADEAAALFPGMDRLDVARRLCAEEGDQLRAAKLYFADADTATVATTKASKPRKAPVSATRVPSDHGLIVFEVPIDWSPGAAPLVAASWSKVTDSSGVAFWRLTMYVHVASNPPLAPSGFARVVEGDVFADDKTYSSDEDLAFALRTIVATWDVITQERIGKPVTDITDLPRQPKRLRSDRRKDITDDGTVRVVTIRGRRPSPPAPRSPADEGTHQRRYDRGRWWVTEHSRSHCMNPAMHDAGCTHEDVTILKYPKGPQDKPFLDTVHVVRPSQLDSSADA